jgi:hypothetical protein
MIDIDHDLDQTPNRNELREGVPLFAARVDRWKFEIEIGVGLRRSRSVLRRAP